MAQRKETKKTIKVRDLKPKKDAKGGMATNVSTNRSVQGHQIGHAFIERPVNNNSDRAVFGIVRGNEKHRAPKIWVEHIRVSDEQ